MFLQFTLYLVLHHVSFFHKSETQSATYVIFLRNNDDLYMLG